MNALNFIKDLNFKIINMNAMALSKNAYTINKKLKATNWTSMILMIVQRMKQNAKFADIKR